MSYYFLKSNIANAFGLVQDDTVIMDNLNVTEDNKYTLGHNFPEFKNILNFLATDTDCLILNGFMGCGKTTLIHSVEPLLNPATLFFKIDCYKATTLDDILIILNSKFKEFYNAKKVVLPKIETNNFKEKIQHYIEVIDKPFLLLLDSFENIAENNYQEIFDFLSKFFKLDKFKIIFSARNFNSDYLDKQNIKMEWSMISPYTQDSVEIYLKENKVEFTDDVLTGIMTVSKGYFLYLHTTLNILKMFGINLAQLLTEYTKKQKGFYDEFIFAKILSLMPSNFSEMIWFLTLVRTGVTEDLLRQFNFLEKDELNYLITNRIVYKVDGLYALKSYIKDTIFKNIPAYTKVKIHKFLKEFYESQLPLKPTERAILLSRNTMRNEIAYHDNNMKLLTKETPKSESSNFVKTFSNNNWVFKKLEKKEEVKEIQPKQEKQSNNTPIKPVKVENEFVDMAEKNENSYEYTKALKYYEKALQGIDNSNLDAKITLLLKIAENYEKLHNWQKTIHYLEKIYEIYDDNEEYLKADFTLFKVANIYKEIYNYSKAKMCFSRILNSESKKSNEFIAQCKLTLADMRDENSQEFQNAIKLYTEALDYAKKGEATSLICEIYFKIGLLYDDNSQTDKALENYVASIQTSENVEENENLSSNYANIAIIYLENRQISLAIDYLNKSIKVDEETKNYDGLYFVYTKLAWIYFKSNQKKAFVYISKALEYAKLLKDDFYIASAYLETGDFYYNLKQDELALKYYILADRYLPSASARENSEKIAIRMKDIKQRQGEVKYKLILDIVKNAKD